MLTCALQNTAKLEIHIPEAFTETRHAVRYHHENFGSTIKDHPIASQLPVFGPLANTTDSIWETFGPLTVAPNGPRTLADYLLRDEPQLSLRINSFRDATLVCLNFLHNVGDGQGVAIFMKAWSDVIEGKEAQVPHRIGAFEDTIARFGSTSVPREQVQFASKLAGLESKESASGGAWDALHSAKATAKLICLNKRVVNKIRQRALSDLVARGFPPEAALNIDPSQPFLSDGDILVSWLSRHALAGFAPSTPQPVTIINSYDARRLPSAFDAFDSSGKPIYLSNATLRGYIYVPSNLVTEAPLGELSAAIRSQLAKQTTPEQIHARLALDCKILNSAQKTRASFIEAGSTCIFFTNWSRARYFEIPDFSGAVVQPGAGTGDSKPGLVSYFHCQPLGVGHGTRNGFQISGKDREGNYWVEGSLTSQGWESLEKDLEALDKLDSVL
jgi:hypothetical protein